MPDPFFVADFYHELCVLCFFMLSDYAGTSCCRRGGDFMMPFVSLQNRCANNLFPSIHCLVSWFCFIGIISDIKIPKWYKVISFLSALAVFVSTLTTRQHVIVDVVGGVALAQICYLIAQKTNIWRCFEKTFDYLNGFFAE